LRQVKVKAHLLYAPHRKTLDQSIVDAVDVMLTEKWNEIVVYRVDVVAIDALLCVLIVLAFGVLRLIVYLMRR
jgi:hypothetical protein